MVKRSFYPLFLAALLGIFLSACNNITATPAKTQNDTTLKPYDSKSWDSLFDKDMAMQIEIAPNQNVWMLTERGNIVFGKQERWTTFSKNDIGFISDVPSDMAISENGVVWIASRHAISRYSSGEWTSIEIPDSSETSFPRLAVSRNGDVWIAMSLCNCENSLRKFDGIQWSDVLLDSISVKAHQVAVSTNDNVWITFQDGTGIARFNGSDWKVYRDQDIWPGYPNFITRIAVDKQGNIFSLNESPFWIGQIDSQENIAKIPFDKNLHLDETRIRIFIDTNHNIWVNACLKDEKNSCISYYNGQKWTTFTNLPFSTVADINEINDGVMLFATEKGLYSYAPPK